MTSPTAATATPNTPAPQQRPDQGEPLSTNAIQLTENRAVYTVAEVSHLLSLSRGNTYAMVRTGEIPSKKIGNRWVIPKDRFHAWLNDAPTASTDDLDREEGSTCG